LINASRDDSKTVIPPSHPPEEPSPPETGTLVFVGNGLGVDVDVAVGRGVSVAVAVAVAVTVAVAVAVKVGAAVAVSVGLTRAAIGAPLMAGWHPAIAPTTKTVITHRTARDFNE
jgi:hypothetical protein